MSVPIVAALPNIALWRLYDVKHCLIIWIIEMEHFYLYFLRPAWKYGLEMLPSVFFTTAIFFLIHPWRKKKLAGKGLNSGTVREIGLLFFVAFVAGLSSITMLPNYFWHTVAQGKLPDFTSGGTFYWHIRLFSDSWFGILGNIVMFLPLGFFPALLWSKPTWHRSVLSGFAMSMLIEWIQLFTGRSSDINDLILNTLGALCGYWLYRCLYHIAPHMTAMFHTAQEVLDG